MSRENRKEGSLKFLLSDEDQEEIEL